MAKLIRVAEAQGSPEAYGMSGAERGAVYRLAIGTGFRANEIRSLTPESFDLDATPPTVTVEAAFSKHKKEDEQPIRNDLAAFLRPWLADKAPGATVFPLHDKTAKMLRVDLARAEIPYKDASGRVFDFHALRGQFITALVMSGAKMKVAQDLARHSDPKLTYNVYSHLSISDKTEALDGLPGTTPTAPQEEIAQATGTHDARPNGPDACTANRQRADAHHGDSLRPTATATRDGRGVVEGRAGSAKPPETLVFKGSGSPEGRQRAKGLEPSTISLEG